MPSIILLIPSVPGAILGFHGWKKMGNKAACNQYSPIFLFHQFAMHRISTITITCLTFLVILGVAAIQAPANPHKNLQVLPQDISSQQLDSIMNTYNVALGVKCKFCHIEVKGFADSLDYVSDAEPMKEQARKMMRMNIHINKTYFYFDKNVRPEYLKTVTCFTCHRGDPFPEQ